MTINPTLVKEVREQSGQERAKESDSRVYVLPAVVMHGDKEVGPWWTPQRDRQLRKFWKTEGMLASTIYNLQAILASVGFFVDGDDSDAVALAEEQINAAEFGQGFKTTIKKLAEDWFAQDNGMFLEIIGTGDVDTPLLVPPTSFAHLDAGRCWRTGDPEFPVWYLTEKYEWVKFHWTRVTFSSSNPSSDLFMRGVGFCAVSRIIAFTQMLRATQRYKNEKISGRQTRAIVTVTGAPKAAVEAAIEAAGNAADNASQYRYSAIPFIAHPEAGREISANVIELAGVPDGFDWKDEITVYAFILALAFGVDAREIWPATSSGSTKADAEMQHRKAMRKGMGDFLTEVTNLFNSRIVPQGVEFVFKPEDREEDAAQATIEKIRVETVMMMSSVLTTNGIIAWLIEQGVLPAMYLDNSELTQTEGDIETTNDVKESQVIEGDSAVLSPPTSDEGEVTQELITEEMENWEALDVLQRFAITPNEVPDFEILPT